MPSVFALVLLALPLLAGRFTYRVSYPSAGADRVHISIETPGLPAGPQDLIIPRAIPMGYGEQPYDRFVDNVQAFSRDHRPLPVSRGEGPRWRLGKKTATIGRIDYEVDLHGMERQIASAADTSKVRAGYMSLLGYSVFGLIEGLEDLPLRLLVDVPKDWPVLTSLAPRSPPSRGHAEGEAADFYALADSQILAGPDFVVRALKSPVPLFLAVYAEGPVDADLLGGIARKAMADVIHYFGDAPFSHYTILQELLRPLSPRHAYGFSMEHLASATFYLSQDRGVTSASPPELIARTRYNFAHHFAHAWIPKRAYPKGYFPFTWELAPVLDAIWFSEGFAQYAAIEAIADALPREKAAGYRETMLETRFRRNLEEAPVFIRQMSAVEISRVASTRYAEDFRTGRNVFSRGGLMAAEMDAWIRRQSGGAKRLRDGLRYLMAWSRRHRRGFSIDELPAILEEATGVDTHPIMQRWLEPLAPLSPVKQ